jgi:hypothetical protein
MSNQLFVSRVSSRAEVIVFSNLSANDHLPALNLSLRFTDCAANVLDSIYRRRNNIQKIFAIGLNDGALLPGIRVECRAWCTSMLPISTHLTMVKAQPCSSCKASPRRNRRSRLWRIASFPAYQAWLKRVYGVSLPEAEVRNTM